MLELKEPSLYSRWVVGWQGLAGPQVASTESHAACSAACDLAV
jgi:hypothetical protein